MAYTPLIYFDVETETRLMSLLDDEINKHYAERTQWIEDFKTAQYDYWAKSKVERATFPFSGASLLIIPLGAIAVEATHARVFTQLFGLKDFVSAKSRNDEFADLEDDVTAMMNYVMLHEMNIREKLQSPILEIIKFGNGIIKPGYERVVKTGVRYVGDEATDVDIVVKQGPCMDSTPLSRFLMPFFDKDPQMALWCGEEHSKSPYEIKLYQNSQLFYPDTMEKLQSWVNQSQTSIMGQERETEKFQDELEKRVAVWPKAIDFFEFWLSFDVDNTGIDKEIQVFYHKGARFIMAARYNPNVDLHRPYRIGKYFPVEHRWTAIGIMKQVEQFQSEITTQHRQRLDNATLANVKMIKISKMSGYGPREPVFPGKIWWLNDMDHVDGFNLGEINESSFANEQATLIYEQQRVGVNELNMGLPQTGTPGTASSDFARIQEGRLRFDFTYANIKEMINYGVRDTASNLQQYGPRVIDYYDYAKGGQNAKKYFEMPANLINDGVIMEITATGQQENKLLDRNNWTQVGASLSGYYQGVVQLGELFGDQQIMKMIALHGIEAATEGMTQLLETYNIKNIDRLVLGDLVKMLKAQLGGGQPPPQGQPNGNQQLLIPGGPPGPQNVNAV